MKYLIYLLLLSGLLSGPLCAQYVQEEDSTEATSPVITPQRQPQRPAWRDRIFPGGSFWLQFGNNTYVQIAPLVGYRVTDRFSAGVGVNYIYQRRRLYYSNGQPLVLKNSVYGGKLFGRYTLYKNIFAQAELEALNFENLNEATWTVERQWITSPLVGGGVIFPIGQRATFIMAALYNLNYDPSRNVYGSPIIVRTGFNF